MKSFNTKKLIALILCCTLILPGCFTFQTASSDEQEEALRFNNRHINVRMKDGSSLEIAAHHYLAVREPSNFYYGIGYYSGPASLYPEKIVIKVTGAPIDSGTTRGSIGASAIKDRKYYNFRYLREGTVCLLEGDLLRIDSAGGSGLWYCSHEYTFGRDELRRGVVPFDQIASIETQKISAPLTAGAVALSLPIVAVFSFICAWVAVGAPRWTNE